MGNGETGKRVRLPEGGTFCRDCGRTSLYRGAAGRWRCPGCDGIPVEIPRTWTLTAAVG